ncbi:amino acid transporter [Inquilinus ginsengisoli]|uniref:Amino acid transporter n=1 Tax=Inquilinus ginsengisoli TaxID=363840 RepID=A0ABU1JPD8_9PROT|nr:APC family permease [Inquilinus ginsengisoli]MDR6290183.1 amino acid transporter [Inquilinus ginsengisoli]
MTDKPLGLTRTLRLPSVVLFGLAYMTPMIVFGTFGILAEKTGGAVPTAYVLALVAVLLTAYSYGRMAAAYPVAGSAYTYTRRAFGGHLGFLVGWAILLDYFFLPMAIWLIGAAYLSAAFPGVPQWVWILAFIAVTSAINIIGIKLANGVNIVLMLVQFAVLAAFVALCIHHLTAGPGLRPLFSLDPFAGAGGTLPAYLAGAAIAAYSFLGFDAVTTLTEETVEPARTIPRAIMLIALIGGGIFIGAAVVTQAAFPGGSFANVDSAAFDIATAIGGDVFVMLFLAGLIVAQFASGLSAQASVGRLLLAMGRDDVLPKAAFGYVHPILRTPVFNIALAGVVALAALKLDVTTSTSFINFGAFVAFVFVNLSVIRLLWLRSSDRGLGATVKTLVVPALGAVANLWLLVSLDEHAKVLGLIWLAVGIVYLAYLTRMFSRQPPETEFREVEDAPAARR